MAYSEIEQYSYDLDLFCKDKLKHIHIATGGGKIPDLLADSDFQNEEFKTYVNDLEENFEIEINPNLIDLLDLDGPGLESYLTDFRVYASKGFYSYDKTNIGEFEDSTFHLVAKPRKNSSKERINPDILSLRNNLPDSFDPFSIKVFIE